MTYSNLHFVGTNIPGEAIANYLHRIFDESVWDQVTPHLDENQTLVIIDPVGVMQEREIWERFGTPRCILHLCNSGYNSQTGGYKRVNIDIHVEAIKEVNTFLVETDYFQEGKPKLV